MYLFYLKFFLRFYNDVMQSHSYCFKMSINSVLGEERNWFGEVCFFKDFYLKDHNSCHKADEAHRWNINIISNGIGAQKSPYLMLFNFSFYRSLMWMMMVMNWVLA